MRRLPIITYRKKKYYVDFKLGEMRRVKDFKTIKFTQLKEGVKSGIKKRLRGLRSKTWHNDYIRGVDD